MTDGETQNAIQIRVERSARLFSMLDPFPFRERDLDPRAEEHIVEWARELPRDRPLRIIVHLPAEEAAGKEAQGIGEAFAHFFAYRADIVAGELKELFRVGRVSLLIGLAVLGLCLFAGQLAVKALGPDSFGPVIREGLIIVGWVANWRPLEIFLYDWWPIARRRNLYRRLAKAEVVVKPEEKAG